MVSFRQVLPLLIPTQTSAQKGSEGDASRKQHCLRVQGQATGSDRHGRSWLAMD